MWMDGRSLMSEATIRKALGRMLRYLNQKRTFAKAFTSRLVSCPCPMNSIPSLQVFSKATLAVRCHKSCSIVPEHLHSPACATSCAYNFQTNSLKTALGTVSSLSSTPALPATSSPPRPVSIYKPRGWYGLTTYFPASES
jgi:hypothetical protein